MSKQLAWLLSLVFALCVHCFAQPQPRRITTIKNMYPAMSPDGRYIAFQSNRTGVDEIYVMNSDGSGIVQLTSNGKTGSNATPSWSPDGKQIAYGREVGKNSEIWVMNADGSNQHGLVTGGDDEHPHWATTGEIIFNSARTSPNKTVEWFKLIHEIFSIRPDGSGLRQRTRYAGFCTFPSLSPDGTRLVFRRVIDGPAFEWDLTPATRNSEIFVANADGTNPTNISRSASFDGWPVWSPDSKTIAFASNRTGPARTAQIFVVNADGTNLHQVTRGDASYAQPSWSPDGKKLYAYTNTEVGDQEWGDIVEIEAH